MLAHSLLFLLPALASALPTDFLQERASSLKGSAVTWKIPTGRPFDDSRDSEGPCGGFGPIAPEAFPLTGGDFSVLARADAGNFEINYSTLSNPTKNSDFKMLVHEFSNTTYRGHHCLNAPDFSSFGAKVGDELTLQIVYTAGTKNTILYTCADVKLVEAATYTVPTGLGCFTGALDVPTAATEDFGAGDLVAASTSSSSSSSFSSGLTAAQKGGIGAGVSVAALLLIAGIAAFFYKKGKKSNALNRNVTLSSVDQHTLGDGASFTSREMEQKQAL